MKVIGIDFGTTGLRAAAMVDGRPLILENQEGEGTTPAFIAISKDGLTHVGEIARLMAAQSAEVVSAVKRLIGRGWDDPLVNSLRASSAYSLVEMDDGTVGFELSGKHYRTSDLCTLLFSSLRATACRQLGFDVQQAVVAVPAYFGIEQRRMLSAAAAAAKLEVLRFVPEPTAAALFYGFGDIEGTVVVYDLGGGTFDVSILEIGDGVFEVLAADGDPLLGGEDIDLRLRDHMLERLGLRSEDLSRASRYVLKREAELAKIALSAHSNYRVLITNLTTTHGRPFTLDIVINQDLLQNLCQDLINRTLLACERAVKGAHDERMRTSEGSYGFDIGDVTAVVLVGGSTRLSFVEECVERYFGKKPYAPQRREDAVALGCAIQAGVLAGQVKDILLLDVLSRTYKLRINGEKTSPVLYKNMTVPVKKSYDYENSFTNVDGSLSTEPILIVSAIEVGNEGDEEEVASVTFEKTDSKNGQIKLKITLDVDLNGLLLLELMDVVSGRRKSIQAAALVKVGVRDRTTLKSAGEGLSGSVPKVLSVSQKQGRRILCVGTEWRSGAGGLSSLNRELCIALAASGHDVRCLVLRTDPMEVASALMKGVSLITATKRSGQSDQVALARRPALPEGWRPDLVIGHGRITGPAAAALIEDHFPEAKRLHIIHMAPDEIEWFKPDRGNDAGSRAEERTQIEWELGKSADFVAAVGPRLHARFLTDFHPLNVRPLRLDPGFDGQAGVPLGPPPGGPWRVMLVGRAEDEELKGLDIAARAMGLLLSRWRGTALELNVRGAPFGTSEDLRDKLQRWAGVGGLAVNVRPYNAEAEQLDADYRRASLVLMPSRSEGFGLVGLEAICAGTPVLVSGGSGLGELLQQKLPAQDAARIVLPVSGTLEQDADTWSHAIERVLFDRDASFARAETVLRHLQHAVKWTQMADEIGSMIA